MSKSIGQYIKGDPVIWAIFFLLCAISVVEVFSALSSLAYKSGDFWAPMLKHTAYILCGACFTFGLHLLPCRFFKAVPILLYPVSIALLLATLFIGEDVNGGARWLSVFGFSFQPSELAKGTVVISVALVLSRSQGEESADPSAFRNILILAGLVCGLIVTDNLSTAVLLALVVFLQMIIGRVPWKQLAGLVAVGLVLLTLFFSVVLLPSDDSVIYKAPGMKRALTWKHRIERHGDVKELTPENFDIDGDGQIAHAHIAIAKSNIVGRMPGNSVQRDFLSQAYSDFIFAIIIEEMGIWGAAGVVLLYIILLFRAGRIANRCERHFPAFLHGTCAIARGSSYCKYVGCNRAYTGHGAASATY